MGREHGTTKPVAKILFRYLVSEFLRIVALCLVAFIVSEPREDGLQASGYRLQRGVHGVSC